MKGLIGNAEAPSNVSADGICRVMTQSRLHLMAARGEWTVSWMVIGPRPDGGRPGGGGCGGRGRWRAARRWRFQWPGEMAGGPAEAVPVAGGDGGRARPKTRKTRHL